MSNKAETAALAAALKDQEQRTRNSINDPALTKRCQYIRLIVAEEQLKCAVVSWHPTDPEYDERIRSWRRDAGDAEHILAGLVTTEAPPPRAALPSPPAEATAHIDSIDSEE